MKSLKNNEPDHNIYEAILDELRASGLNVRPATQRINQTNNSMESFCVLLKGGGIIPFQYLADSGTLIVGNIPGAKKYTRVNLEHPTKLGQLIDQLTTINGANRGH